MPLYNYYALNEKGRTVKGMMSASNEVDLEARLKDIALDLTFSKEASKTGAIFSRSIAIKDLILLCVQMEQLERAGVPILDAISDVRDTTDVPKMKNLMSEIYESVKGGKLLSEAMAEHPTVFSTVFTGLVAAGEKTGNMAEIFSHLGRHLKWTNDIRRKVKKATYYPMFMGVMMFAVIAMMMLFVIPKLSDFLLKQGFDLPAYTHALISFSQFFEQYWYAILLVPILFFIVNKVGYRLSDGYAFFMDSLKLRIPVIGSTIRKIELSRFTHFFAITFRSGIGILDCLDIAQKVVHNRVMRQDISAVRKAVSEGSSMTKALTNSNQFPSLVTRMFKVGEESGNLDQALENINFFYDREVNDAVNNMIGIIQPMLTIVLGGIMLWVSIAVFGPLYGSFEQMSF